MRSAALLICLGACSGASPLPETPTGPTGEKPQSKVWHANGSWWAILGAPGGLRVWKFESAALRAQALPAVLPHSTEQDSCDVLSVGEQVFVLAHGGTGQRLYVLEWKDPGYRLLDGCPVFLALGGETSTLARDSTGRLWIAADRPSPANPTKREIRVVWSEAGDFRTWDRTGAILADGISDDDLCAVTAFGGNRIGVFWSDQARDRFGFRAHEDGKAPDRWEETEVVAQGGGIADDHLHLAVDGSGRVWAVTKDSRDQFTVWRRGAEGKWDLRVPVPHRLGTRPILVHSESLDRIYVAYTDWTSRPCPIGLRSSPRGIVRFSEPVTLFPAPPTWNDVSGPKQAVDASTGLLLIARSQDRVEGILVRIDR